MPLYIRDATIEDLARRVQQVTGAKTTTEAVRLALEHGVQRAIARMSFDERNAEVIGMADRLGKTDPEFDMKRFTDEMWGDIRRV